MILFNIVHIFHYYSLILNADLDTYITCCCINYNESSYSNSVIISTLRDIADPWITFVL